MLYLRLDYVNGTIVLVFYEMIDMRNPHPRAIREGIVLYSIYYGEDVPGLADYESALRKVAQKLR